MQYETRENIYKAFIVFYFVSAAIVDALLLKKKIISLFSNYNNNTSAIYSSLDESIKFGILRMNIVDEIKNDKQINSHNKAS